MLDPRKCKPREALSYFSSQFIPFPGLCQLTFYWLWTLHARDGESKIWSSSKWHRLRTEYKGRIQHRVHETFCRCKDFCLCNGMLSPCATPKSFLGVPPMLWSRGCRALAGEGRGNPIVQAEILVLKGYRS